MFSFANYYNFSSTKNEVIHTATARHPKVNIATPSFLEKETSGALCLDISIGFVASVTADIIPCLSPLLTSYELIG